MATQIFLNLAVKDLDRSVNFFTQLGYTFNPKFTDENATSMIVSDTIFVMLLTEKFFASFMEKEICDTKTHQEAMIALSAESREDVDSFMEKVLKAGGIEHRPAQDHGWMYGRAFLDLDGHHWEMFFMDMAALPES